MSQFLQLQNQRRITQTPQGKSQKKLSYLKVKPCYQEPKQSLRKIVVSNNEILVPKSYNMIEEIQATFQKNLKSSHNIDQLSVKSEQRIIARIHYIICPNIKLKLKQNYGLKAKKREIINFGMTMNIQENTLFQVLQKMYC